MNKVIHNGVDIGHEFRSGSVLIFFGNAACNLEVLKLAYPHLDFNFIKQVHGNKVVSSTKDFVKADAHWTTKANSALCIKTADCLPVMISDEEKICAIHAGWRGLDSEILFEAQDIFTKAPSSKRISAIGPHIQCKSFEVDKSLADSLQKKYINLNPLKLSDSLPQSIIKHHTDETKAYIDLHSLARAQLLSGGILEHQLFRVSEDTFSNLDYHSFRRDKESAGRQMSFIAIDKP